MTCYPTNAQELLSGKSENAHRFALLASVRQQEKTVFIAIDPTSPIAVSSMVLRHEIIEKTGVALPLRQEIHNQAYKARSPYRLLGAGSLLEMRHGRDSFMPLLQRDGNAPSNPGKWTHPSGLCSAHPLMTAVAELQEELAVLERAEDGESLVVRIPMTVGSLKDKGSIQAAVTFKRSQEQAIRRALPEEYRRLPMTYAALPVLSLPLPAEVPPVYLKMPSDTDYQRIPFFAVVDEENQTLTLSTRYEGILNDEREYLLVDAEAFRRNVTCASVEDLQSLECTPALAAAVRQGICFA